MAKKIAFTNQKEGVGKTIVSITVAGVLAKRGSEMLLIDLNPQGYASEGARMGRIKTLTQSRIV